MKKRSQASITNTPNSDGEVSSGPCSSKGKEKKKRANEHIDPPESEDAISHEGNMSVITSYSGLTGSPGGAFADSLTAVKEADKEVDESPSPNKSKTPPPVLDMEEDAKPAGSSSSSKQKCPFQRNTWNMNQLL